MALPDYVLLTPEDWVFDPGTSGQIAGMNNLNLPTASQPGMYSGSRVRGGATPGTLTKDVSSQSYTEGWLTVWAGGASVTGDLPFLTLSGATTDLFRLSTINVSEHWMAEYYNGSTWTQIGSDETVATLTNGRRIDIHWNILDAGGTFEVFIDGASKWLLSGDTKFTSDTTIDTVECKAPSTSTQEFSFGGCMIDGSDTRKLVIDEQTSSSAGNSSDYVGSEASIDDRVGSGTYSSVITFDAALEKGDFNWFGSHADITTSYTIEGVKVVLLAKAQSEPGFYMQGYARISGADYDGDDAPQAPGGSDDRFVTVSFDVDPSTSPPTAWGDIDDVDAADFGYRSKTTA